MNWVRFGRTSGVISRVILFAEIGPRIIGWLAPFLHLNVSFIICALLGAVWTVNSVKAKTTEQRVNGIVNSIGNILNGSTTFTGLTVNGNAQVTGDLLVNTQLNVATGIFNSLSMQGDLSMGGHSLTNVQNCDLSMGIPPDYTAGNDGCSGGNWCSGERGYYNNLASGWNTLISEMINRGLIS